VPATSHTQAMIPDASGNQTPQRSPCSTRAALRALGLTCAAASFAVLALAGCGSLPSPPISADDDKRLFDEAYANIARYYIEPLLPGALAMAGLSHLSTVDPALSIERSEEEVVLRYAGYSAGFAAPDGHDPQGWADLTNKLVTTGRTLSPSLAILSSEGVDQTVLEGSLTLLDRFSHYSVPEVARERRAVRDGFGGIGLTLDPESAELRIAEIIPDTPAAAVGLKVDDRIVAIDDADARTLSRDDAVQRLRGPIDSVVGIAVTRANRPEHLDFLVRRVHIVPPTVTLREAAGIAHLRITGFNQQTAQSLDEKLQQAHREMGSSLRGIVLDLRGNPGGLLEQSVEVASRFLDGATVISTVGRVPESIQYFIAPHREIEKLPIVVLVNGGSASASEIVAAALQDTGRAVVVGSASYGKGTVQNVQHLSNDGELTVTWARLITPAGYSLHEHGVVPTICTANLPDDAGAVGTAIGRSTGVLAAELRQARADLDEAGWQRLRASCPGQHADHALEVRTADRLLSDPLLYARALGASLAAAGRPVATAGVLR
jgi:carboxyl-terminal processing protease